MMMPSFIDYLLVYSFFNSVSLQASLICFVFLARSSYYTALECIIDDFQMFAIAPNIHNTSFFSFHFNSVPFNGVSPSIEIPTNWRLRVKWINETYL